ncbi:hypothetical protein HMPREF3150_00789 [Pseudomonas aeruginosa]|nr:hypothetical protein HMPREF3150_00789 [Pseudomonas aeruginosa]
MAVSGRALRGRGKADATDAMGEHGESSSAIGIVMAASGTSESVADAG